MNKFLLVVDMQYDFIDGSLGTKEAQGIVPNVAKRIEEAQKDGYYVIFTQDTHYADYMDKQEGKKLPVVHCQYQTHGWMIHVAIAKAASDYCWIEKSTFGSLQAAERIDDMLPYSDINGEDTVIEVIGLCTDICVVSNALFLKTRFPEALIRVRASCCAGVTPEKHQAALEVMRSCQIDVIEGE